MNPPFDFNDLFVFDLANNHQGDVAHGRRIIRAFGQIAQSHAARAALKFQYRQIDTFIHPAHKRESSNKHIPRFMSTRLTREEFDELLIEVREAGLLSMATPFDESSVDQIVEQDIQIVKVASCSATDWPLLEKIADCNKPVVFSTGGLTWSQIDDLVSFFDHRRSHYAIMHCVAIYPTPTEKMQLNQIEQLRQRYPRRVIGFSTHESPEDTTAVTVAVAKGARILERHVGMETDSIKLNAYSSNPEQLGRWIIAAQQARILCGSDNRAPPPEEEAHALQSLARGVFARSKIKPEQNITRSDVYFAMPWSNGQLVSGRWQEGIKATKPIVEGAPLLHETIIVPDRPEKQVLIKAIHGMKALLNEARIALPPDFETEFSHHYGISRFTEVGATMVTCVNRSYCKKLIIQLPGQRHPNHFHKSKEETFMVLYGNLSVDIEGRRRTLFPGDTLLVQQGVWHEFWTETGVVFEEISTADCTGDSFYEDKEINRVPRCSRKTRVNQWGRYQL